MEKIGKLELPLPSNVIQQQLQKVVDVVSLGLQLAERGQIQDLSIPNSTFQIAPAKNKKLDIETAKKEYIASILANGLRDSIEIIGISLEWARKFCFIWTRD